MEPFALFHLLQSLFSTNNEPTAAKNEPVDAPLPTEERAPVPTQEPILTSSQEAALRFLSEHENRAKRTKKP